MRVVVNIYSRDCLADLVVLRHGIGWSLAYWKHPRRLARVRGITTVAIFARGPERVAYGWREAVRSWVPIAPVRTLPPWRIECRTGARMD